MDRLMDGRTTFMIAHRLSTLRDCDIQLQLDDGRIADIALPAAIRWGRRVEDQLHGYQPPMPSDARILD
jgi:ABC-type bacteriocin/lantibiotic exporter with double-glycine peptidase domain